MLASILFHHSNLELPLDVERWLSRVIVTPRMHGIHHSVVRDETESNWSSGLSVWDWLHRTLRLNVPQPEITIGVPGFQRIDDGGLAKMLALPFDVNVPLAGDNEDQAARPVSRVPPTLLMP